MRKTKEITIQVDLMDDVYKISTGSFDFKSGSIAIGVLPTSSDCALGMKSVGLRTDLYEVDWDLVNTIDDIMKILKLLNIRVPGWFLPDDTRHLMKKNND